ncbi:MAG: hypothetical protein HC898_02360 [Phycisphaerales bacterium]|nr:hypothetical protein [Phycisphaerales bacterium]
MNQTETYVLCEGYHDRAFWAGALSYLKCNRPEQKVKDPWGKLVVSGQFGYTTPGNHFIRITPVSGNGSILHFARQRINRRNVDKVDRIVMCIDSDLLLDEFSVSHTDSNNNELLAWTRQIDSDAIEEGAYIRLKDGTMVNLIEWKTTSTEAGHGVPGKQTLERIICSALAATFPQRAYDVQQWLDSRHEKPGKSSAKEHAFSYLAGWFADSGSYEGAIAQWWNDPNIREHIIAELEKTGIWSIMHAIACTNNN